MSLSYFNYDLFSFTILSLMNFKEMQRIDPNEEIIYHFMETQAKVLADLQKHPFQHSFNWENILRKKKTIRVTMDTELKKLNKSKKRFSIII